MPTADKPKKVEERTLPITLPTQVIYADRILNAGIGSSVSRLTLAMEIGENTFSPAAQLVIPTPALFEALEFLSSTIKADENMKKKIVTGLDTFKENLTKTNE